MNKTNETNRYFYAARSYMGTNFTYDSACWKAYRFTSAKERDAWVKKNEYKDGKVVAESVSRKIAMKIIGYRTSKLADGVVFENDIESDPFLMFAFR